MPDGVDQIQLDWIAEDLVKGNLIPFLGAGASAYSDLLSKPPSAAELALTLARKSLHPDFRLAHDYRLATNDPGKADLPVSPQQLRAYSDCTNLALVASWVELDAGDRDRIRQELREALANQNRPLDYNELHKLIADVAARTPLAIITTNYDDLIERALEERSIDYDLFVVAIDQQPAQAGSAQARRPAGRGIALFRPAGETRLSPVTGETEMLQLERAGTTVRLKRSAVFKLHGHVDRNGAIEDTFVITEEDYVKFLGHMSAQDSLIPADLVSLMVPRRMLFLGYGLRDWNMRVLLDRLSQLRTRTLKSYAVVRNVSPVERILWERRLVKVYDADLASFVQALGAKISDLASSDAR
jgi:hypothetical protein